MHELYLLIQYNLLLFARNESIESKPVKLMTSHTESFLWRRLIDK